MKPQTPPTDSGRVGQCGTRGLLTPVAHVVGAGPPFARGELFLYERGRGR